MKAVLNRQALQVALAASSSNSDNLVLQCVRIGNGEIAASDGFVFAKCPITTDPPEGEEILILAEDIADAARIIQHGDIILESHGGLATFRDQYSTVSLKVNLQRVKYPDTSKLLPKTKRKAYVAFSKDVLRKVIELATPSGDVLLIKVREPNEPVIVISGDMTIYAMPINHPEEE